MANPLGSDSTPEFVGRLVAYGQIEGKRAMAHKKRRHERFLFVPGGQ
jgi:hypothetical protein